MITPLTGSAIIVKSRVLLHSSSRQRTDRQRYHHGGVGGREKAVCYLKHVKDVGPITVSRDGRISPRDVRGEAAAIDDDVGHVWKGRRSSKLVGFGLWTCPSSRIGMIPWMELLIRCYSAAGMYGLRFCSIKMTFFFFRLLRRAIGEGITNDDLL